MARPKKTENIENTEPKVNVKKVVETKDNNLSTEDLLAEIARLKKLVESNTQSNTVNVTNDMTRRIKVTSLAEGGVNLRTGADGSAKRFRFEKFGQTLPIIYEDLINCINMDRWLFEDGLVYINDKTAIVDNYLEDNYEHFLTKETIERILDYDNDTIKDFVSSATQSIQETICTLLAEKINKGMRVDLNKIKLIGDLCSPKIDIEDLAKKLL